MRNILYIYITGQGWENRTHQQGTIPQAPSTSALMLSHDTVLLV
ncbi:hypothetical protein NBRC111894_2602 [Sporolactobacillus inulinus]|uniref:Uncharacterized protein n=1 Tax=Sporolactobacillus inulinus TaxID=2078 RepID=A0A4Y1ZEZ6_9BACL|nr:hypothetical protein NBRC111894_2602 [Sporolactobacillus inulinus]